MKMAVFQWFRCFVGSPSFGASPGLLLASSWPLAGLLLASCWRFAGLLLASCWRLAGLLLACCWLLAGLLLASSWPLAGFLLASSFPTKISLENRFLGRLAKTVHSLGLFLASCWPLAGLLLASSWPLAGFLLASSFPTRISLENRFLGKLAKTVNSLHENGCFSMASVFRGVPPIWGLFLAFSWPLAGLFLASCWLLAGFKLPHEDFSRKSVFGKARENGEFSS